MVGVGFLLSWVEEANDLKETDSSLLVEEVHWRVEGATDLTIMLSWLWTSPQADSSLLVEEVHWRVEGASDLTMILSWLWSSSL